MGGKKVLILCEKPDSAARVAKALDESDNPIKRKISKVPYYEAERNGERLIIVPALGHLYAVAPKVTDRNVFPVFDFHWVPKYKAERGAENTRAWIEVLSNLSKDAQGYILATDYDIEGATLGYTILKYACGEKEKEAKRMKFSTLTAEELKESYGKLLPHIEFPTVEAGICRHFLDAIYGINLSRAMTVAAKRWSGKYATLSTGRVQGPTLNFLVEREKAVNTFVPTPYWVVRAKVRIKDSTYDVEYERDMIGRRDEADAIINACRGETGRITEIKVKKFRQNPPVPFDLGTLQTEAYGFFGYTPRRTLDIAERLYLDALISYPRTSSQKLPPTINYKAILESLSRESSYRKLASNLLKLENLRPKEGKKEDPAHPAVYPTGSLPERPLSGPERNIWDLIVRRFMAVFGDPAFNQSVRVSITLNGHLFYLRGRQIIKEGWMIFYRPYIRVEEVILPPLEEGEEVEVEQIIREDKFTKPPPRHNPSSLLRKMEEETIGTKATRADIIETLYSRGYISEERITVSELGFDVIDILNRYCPEVISVSFTRDLEERMEEIERGNEKMDNVLSRSVERLKPVLEGLKTHEEPIGQVLSEAIRKARMQERTVGGCPVCETGKLMILYSRRTGKRFIGCTNFFRGFCKTSFPLPQKGTVKPMRRRCSACGWPLIQVRFKGRRPWNLCFNSACPSKEENRKK